MTNEEKQLLLKDLCGRLPYGVKGRIFSETTNGEFDITGDMIFNDEPFVVLDEINVRNGEIRVTAIENVETRDFIDSVQDWGDPYTIETFKPYLRPMSSMTEEELNECVCQSGIKDIECSNWQDIPKEKQFEARLNHAIAVFLTDSNNVDWLNAHHFDYRGLIEKGLALEAPEGMYN